MAGPTRLELATSGVTGRHSNQLNYDPASKFKIQIRQSVMITLLRVYLANPFYSHFFVATLNFFKRQQQINGRRNRARTCDPRLVRPVLSQLSYPPLIDFLIESNPNAKGGWSI